MLIILVIYIILYNYKHHRKISSRSIMSVNRFRKLDQYFFDKYLRKAGLLLIFKYYVYILVIL